MGILNKSVKEDRIHTNQKDNYKVLLESDKNSIREGLSWVLKALSIINVSIIPEEISGFQDLKHNHSISILKFNPEIEKKYESELGLPDFF